MRAGEFNEQSGSRGMSALVGDIREIIFETLRSSLPKPVEITEKTHIVDDLGLNSVAVMDFVMEIEDRLDMSVPLDKIAEIETVGDLIAAMQNLRSGS